MRNFRLLVTRSEPLLLAAALPTVVSPPFCRLRSAFTGDRLNDNPRGSLFQFLRQSLSSLAAPQVHSSDPVSKVNEAALNLLDSEDELTPRAIVEQLDRFIIGQQAAKRAVAIALRNRWRRHKIAAPLSSEIIPKNILMIGPTGCGKTEIARRLAKLASAPFVKVEATKFTEVGFHGRDVDQIVRDLVDNAVLLMKQNLRLKMLKDIEKAVEEKIIEKLVGPQEEGGRDKETFRRLLRSGQLDEEEIEFDPGSNGTGKLAVDGPYGSEAFPGIFVKVDKVLNVNKSDKKRMKISEVKPLIEEQELDKILPQEMIQREAIKSVEQDGIVFIDEIDKIVVSSSHHHGADASSEGVQRDLLPIIEGSVVNTKLGNVSTDHILFICSGAFHHVKPSDMLAELQGRLPIRVELKGLTKYDFYRILTEPENSMLRQQEALLETEGVKLRFTEAAVKEVARVAEEVNKTVDNIGARRLYTVLERILEEISFNAPELAKKTREQGEKLYNVIIDKDQVVERVGELMKKADLSKYIL